MTGKSVREQAIEAAARAAFETEFPRYSGTAVEDSNRWSWLGDGGEAVRNSFRIYAAAALAAAVPVLLNDLADSIGNAGKNAWTVEETDGLFAAADLVRAAAEGWGQ